MAKTDQWQKQINGKNKSIANAQKYWWSKWINGKCAQTDNKTHDQSGPQAGTIPGMESWYYTVEVMSHCGSEKKKGPVCYVHILGTVCYVLLLNKNTISSVVFRPPLNHLSITKDYKTNCWTLDVINIHSFCLHYTQISAKQWRRLLRSLTITHQ